MESMVECVDRRARVAAPLHARDVQAVAASVIADRERERQSIFDDDGIASDISLAADAEELVNAEISADIRALLDNDMTRQRRAVCHDDMIAKDTVMCDMRLRHNQAI